MVIKKNSRHERTYFYHPFTVIFTKKNAGKETIRGGGVLQNKTPPFFLHDFQLPLPAGDDEVRDFVLYYFLYCTVDRTGTKVRIKTSTRNFVY